MNANLIIINIDIYLYGYSKWHMMLMMTMVINIECFWYFIYVFSQIFSFFKVKFSSNNIFIAFIFSVSLSNFNCLSFK